MSINFDIDAANAVFSLPNITGKFGSEFAAYLRGLGARRPLVMLAFPPKAAGTFLCGAAVEAINGQMVRAVHAQGGRDGTPYLPTFILYYAGGYPESTLVTHVHMQALPSNRFFLEAFDIRPVIMVRNVADMLTSYLDQLEQDQAADNWLNCYLPPDFLSVDEHARSDFAIDMMGPWYASYFATWTSYAREAPDRVCVLRYSDLRRDAAGVLETALRHSRTECSRAQCEKAVTNVWNDRAHYRFNHGVEGRGRSRFTPQQLERLERMLFGHYDLSPYRDELFG
jgi:Sulfotransferase domain